MKGGPKCRKWGGLGWLRVTQGYGENVAMFLFKINRNYASILYRFRDTVSYLSNVAEFNLYPNCVWRPRWGGGTQVEFSGNLWHQKTSVEFLGYCVALLTLFYV